MTNEMLKCSQRILGRCLVKCFNVCLVHGLYPRSWAKGYTVPIHKAGDPTIPSRYRGITISSAVGKLCNSILNERIDVYLRQHLFYY